MDPLSPGEQQIQDYRRAGFSDDEIGQWQQQETQSYQQAGFSQDEINQHFGIKEPDMAPSKDYVTKNLQAYNSKVEEISPVNASTGVPKQQTPAKGFWEALEAGWEMSVAGLGIRHQLPETVVGDNPDTAVRIGSMMGQVAGDLPAMVAGGLMGTTAGTVAGGAWGGFIGAGAGAMLGGAAGTFAAPAAMRKILIDHYQKGDIKDSADFAQRAMATTWEAIKGSVTGITTAVAGPAAEAVAGPVAGLVAELGAMTSVSKVLEGELPQMRDFTDGAILLGAFKAAHVTSGKFMDIYAKTGEKPHQVLDAAQSNVQLKQELAATTTELPNIENPKIVNPNFEAELKAAQEKGLPSESVPKELTHPVFEEAKPEPPPKPELEPHWQDIADKVGAPEEKLSWKDKLVNLYTGSVEGLKEQRTKNVDYTLNLKRAIDEVLKETGGKLSEEDNAHIAARLFASHVDKVAAFVNEGTRDAFTGEINGEGLNKVYEELGDDTAKQAKFDLYSMAKQGVERFKRGQMPWGNFDVEGALKVIKEGEPEFEALRQRRLAFQNRVLEYGFKKGLVSEKSYRRMLEAGENYFPLARIMDEENYKGSSSPALLKRFWGSERQVQDPRQTILENTEALLRRAEINDIRQMAVRNLTKPDGTSDFLTKAPVKMKSLNVSSEELSKALKKQGFDLEPEDVTFWRPDTQFLKENQLRIYEDGKAVIYEGDPGVVATLKRLEGDSYSMNMATKVLSGFNKALRVGQTADIGFGVRHLIRSTTMAGVYSKTGQIPFWHPAFALAEFMKGESQTYKDWLYNGGAVTYREMAEKAKAITDLQEADSKYPFLDHAWNVITTPIHASEALIKNTENLVRFTEYKRATEQGKTPTAAAFLSREIIPDPQKAGLTRSIIRTGTAFHGAHINSLDRLAQEFIDNPKSAAAKLSVLTALSAMVWMHNRGDEEIEKLPDYQRDLYWNLNLSRMSGTEQNNTGMIVRIPKPWAPGVLFGSGIERLLDKYVKGKENAMEGFFSEVMKAVVPDIMPTVAAPILDHYANKNHFTGRMLVDNDQLKEMPELQYSPYTSETAKQLGKLLGHVPYVKDLGFGEVKLASPAVIENYIRGWTGTVGGWALKIGDEGLRKAGITPDNVGKSSTDTIADLPLLNEFITRYPGFKTQDVIDFQKLVDDTSKQLNSEKVLLKKGDYLAAQALREARPDLEINLKGAAQAVGVIRKNITQVQDNPEIPPIEKRQLVDTLLFQMGAIVKDQTKMVHDIQKAIQQNQELRGQ